MRIPDFLVRFLLLLAAMSIGACELPRDGRGTLDRVRGGVMRVGVSPSEPWVKADAGQEPSGIEVDLVRGWAASLGARIEWARGAQTELAEALEHGHLDAMIAGLTADAPWGGRLGLSQPYTETDILVAAPPGTPVPADLEGQRVAVDPDRPHLAALVREEGAQVVAPGEAPGAPEAVYDLELPARGLVAGGGEALRKEARVIAVVPGENAFLLSLDRFLAAQGLEERAKAARGR